MRLTAGSVSSAFRDVFRIRLVTGRFFTKDEEVVGRHRVVVLGHDAWTRRFGANPDVVGSLVTLNGVLHEVVGILEPFEFPDREVEIGRRSARGRTAATRQSELTFSMFTHGCGPASASSRRAPR